MEMGQQGETLQNSDRGLPRTLKGHNRATPRPTGVPQPLSALPKTRRFLARRQFPRSGKVGTVKAVTLSGTPAGLGLDSRKPTWTLRFHSAWSVGFVPGFGFWQQA